MLDYVTVGANDLNKFVKFYDALLAPLGAKRLRSFDHGVFYGENKWELAVVKAYDGNPAKPGNGTMAALCAPSQEIVDQVHALALELGGVDEGGLGIRGKAEIGFYGAYFRDIEGNKICVFHMGSA